MSTYVYFISIVCSITCSDVVCSAGFPLTLCKELHASGVPVSYQLRARCVPSRSVARQMRSESDWLVESMERRWTTPLSLPFAMGEFVERWGDIKTYLKEMKYAATRREQEIQAALAANTPGTSIRNKEKEFHISEPWYLIRILAGTLQNGLDAAKQCARLNRRGAISQVRQQPFSLAAGILWHDTRLKRCDYIFQQRMRKKEAKRLFWERKIVSRKRKREPGEPAQY